MHAAEANFANILSRDFIQQEKYSIISRYLGQGEAISIENGEEFFHSSS